MQMCINRSINKIQQYGYREEIHIKIQQKVMHIILEKGK